MENHARQKHKFCTKTLVTLRSSEKSKLNNFSTSFGEKNTPKQAWIGFFLILKVYCAYSNNGKNVKITETVAIAVTKHRAKF